LTFDTLLWNAVGKVSYQMNPKNKCFVSHEPQGRTWIDATAATSPESFTDYHFTLQRMSSAGWTGTLSSKLLASALRRLGYYFPLTANSPDNFFTNDTGKLVMEGAHRSSPARSRSQAVRFASTYHGHVEGPHPRWALNSEGAFVGRLRVVSWGHE
jgi:hypothetical protein